MPHDFEKKIPLWKRYKKGLKPIANTLEKDFNETKFTHFIKTRGNTILPGITTSMSEVLNPQEWTR